VKREGDGEMMVSIQAAIYLLTKVEMDDFFITSTINAPKQVCKSASGPSQPQSILLFHLILHLVVVAMRVVRLGMPFIKPSLTLSKYYQCSYCHHHLHGRGE
jgi:hypothetical protein